MNVPREIIKVWRKHKEHGFITAIANKSGLDPRTVSRAINDGTCEDSSFHKINDAIKSIKKEKAELIKQTLDDLN
jgi:hypothetical protein